MGRRLLRAAQVSLQHAARVVLHQKGPQLIAVVHDIISLDPIHAPSEREPEAWPNFLKAFNEWAHQRGGIPLLNQSPFVKKVHVVSAYGDRWKKLGDWLRTVDPDGKMVNEFFAELL